MLGTLSNFDKMIPLFNPSVAGPESTDDKIVAITVAVESMKTMSMETVSIGVLDKSTEHYLRSKDKAQNAYDVFRHIRLHMSKYKKKEDLQPIMSNLQPNCCLKVN